MKLGIAEWLKKIFGGAPPATATAPAPKRAASRINSSKALTAKLTRINAADARITAAQAKIEELTPKLETAKQLETAADQALLDKAKTGEDSRQYVEAQQRFHADVVTLSNGIMSAQSDLASAKDEREKA